MQKKPMLIRSGEIGCFPFTDLDSLPLMPIHSSLEQGGSNHARALNRRIAAEATDPQANYLPMHIASGRL
ncbi:MAG: hypothetical protein BAA00_13595 [Parageobacillus thermoglucosidasius]|nr:MAG: hypothetical protein BAA00_13595 [Parageobacillus thermoglucosidasius]